MNRYLGTLIGFAAYCIALLWIAPAFAQGLTASRPIVVEWTAEGFANHVSTGNMRRVATATAVRAAANAICREEFPKDVTACLALVAAATFQTPPANGLDDGTDFLVLEYGPVLKDRKRYIRITVAVKPAE
jgi:hypothetical protein